MIEFPSPDIEDFLRYPTLATFAVNTEDTRIAFATNIAGQFDIWEVEGDSFYPYPLTHNGQMVHAIFYDPQDRYILFSMDLDGNETPQIYMMPPTGGRVRTIRSSAGHRFYPIALSDDGNRLYYTSDKDNRFFLNTYVYDIIREEERVLITGEQSPTYLIRVSPDERYFLAIETRSNTHMILSLHYDGQKIPIVSDTNQAYVVHDAVFGEEDHIYLTTNYDTEFSYLARYTISTGTMERLLALDGKSVGDIAYDAKQHQIYCVVASGVEDQLYQYDIKTGSLNREETPTRVINQIRLSDHGVLYLDGSSDIWPRNLFRRRPGQGTFEAITQNRSMGAPPGEAVESHIVEYPSFDGQIIEALWFSPPQEARNGYTIIWPHGGPQAAERRQYRGMVQYLVSRGFQFFAPNFRGSTGYGSQFAQRVEGDWGEGPRKDMVAGMDWIITQGLADATRLFLMGGSYGGYMALLLHGRHRDYFQAVVDIFGPSNLFTFYETVPDSWKPVMDKFLGNPVTQKDKFITDSPITYVSHMNRPMLVIQGANDPRVVKAESDQMVQALREHGAVVEYMVLDDEGHGFSKKENEILVYRKIVEFFGRHMR